MSEEKLSENVSGLSMLDNAEAPSQLRSLQDLEPPRQPELSEIQNIALHTVPPTIPAHRSHDSSNNLKRSDPFQFGSRFLESGDDVFEWNAWDHVDPSKDELFQQYAQQQYTFQMEHRVSEFDRNRFNQNPHKWWDKFYGNNKENFFKNRKWLQQEFPVLSRCTGTPHEPLVDGEQNAEAHETEEHSKLRGPAREGGHWVSEEQSGPMNVIMELGAGAGNTAFPLLKANQNTELIIHASDFSVKAVELIRSNPEYDTRHIRAEVWDMASVSQSLPEGVEPGSVDVVMLIFAFSALNPRQWPQAVKNVWTALRPGGEVCFRDYGRGDLAQVRFKKGRLLEENFYIRGDGTRVYFFELQELRDIWEGKFEKALANFEVAADGETESKTVDDSNSTPSFEILALAADRRLLVNRKLKLKMYRNWTQGRFRKPISTRASS